MIEHEVQKRMTKNKRAFNRRERKVRRKNTRRGIDFTRFDDRRILPPSRQGAKFGFLVLYFAALRLCAK
jgi:hypothetical protein